jgi:uncharacterized protein (TIGR02677 family)
LRKSTTAQCFESNVNSAKSHETPTGQRVAEESAGRLTLFAYTVEPLAWVYRATMRLFLDAKSRYRIQFRPDEIAAELRHALLAGPEPAHAVVERCLDRLVEWGNLRRSHDTGRVTTLEDFRRRHFLYQITPAGEVAERAVGEVLEALEKSGSLQSVMLGTIRRSLTAIAAEIEQSSPRPEHVFEQLFNLTEQFNALTQNASTFLTRLNEAIDSGDVNADAFIVYKQAVIEYLDSFIGELSREAPRIARTITQIERAGSERMIALAAAADAAPAPLGLADPAEKLRRKWRGIAAWFVGDGQEPPTVDLLRASARSAINRILLVLERLHEKRFRRVSRTADLLRLAGWFDEASRQPGGSERAARLFQAAFGLFGARHLGGREPDADLVDPSASWWDAPPVLVAPSLRATGRVSAAGRPGQIADHSRVKQLLVDRLRDHREAGAAALSLFADRGPLALADLPVLTGDELAMLLSLLDRLLSVAPGAAGRREVRSRDGRLRLTLDLPGAPGIPVPADEASARAPGTLAVVRTAAGCLTLPAYVITVEDRMPQRIPAQASA